MSEPLIGLLAELPSAELDLERGERIRKRCHAQLARRASRSTSHERVLTIKAAQVWQPVIAILGAAYLTDVVIQAIRLYATL